MDLRLTGKHVLITGGSRGIGYASAQEFLREGCTVSLVGRDPARMEEARSALGAGPARVGGFCADLTDYVAALRAVDQAEAERGPIDILVNSAGAARRTPFPELEPQAWHDAMQAKFFTYVHVMNPLVKRMGGRGSGVIVNVIGMGGKVATPTHLAGGAANAALMLVSAGLAAAWGPKGVRVNAVNPALTLTDRLAEGLAADARLRNSTPDEILKAAEAKMPLGRIARPEDIADVVVFLASPRAGYVSGAIVSMDGASTPMVV